MARRRSLSVEAERRQRELRLMGAAEYVALGWLTGERVRMPRRGRRGPYRKGRARRSSP